MSILWRFDLQLKKLNTIRGIVNVLILGLRSGFARSGVFVEGRKRNALYIIIISIVVVSSFKMPAPLHLLPKRFNSPIKNALNVGNGHAVVGYGDSGLNGWA